MTRLYGEYKKRFVWWYNPSHCLAESFPKKNTQKKKKGLIKYKKK
jgi:hypothetical protein